jgi:hypothetical protein
MATYRRARAAGDAISAEYAGKIEAIRKDRSLTPDQRASAIFELRLQQKAAVRAIRRRILDEERQAARANRPPCFPRLEILKQACQS